MTDRMMTKPLAESYAERLNTVPTFVATVVQDTMSPAWGVNLERTPDLDYLGEKPTMFFKESALARYCAEYGR